MTLSTEQGSQTASKAIDAQSGFRQDRNSARVGDRGEWRPLNDVKPFSAFFLVGCPRSGTTVLQAALNRHPDICVPPETKLFVHFHRLPHLFRRRCVARLERDLRISLSDLPGGGADLSTVELLHHSFARFRDRIDRRGVRLIGEKTPEHTAHLPEILQQFPAAKVVAIVRNGYHVAESLARMPWLNCDLRSGGAIWEFYMQHITEFAASHPESLCVVRFEDLVEMPTPTIASIFEFLGVDPDHAAECLEPNSQFDQDLFPAHEGAWKNNAIGRVSALQCRPKASLGNWQLRQIEDGCYDSLGRWGYLRSDMQSDQTASGDAGFTVPSGGEQTDRTSAGSGMLRAVRRLLVYKSLMRVALRLPLVYICSELRRRYGLVVERLGLRF